jgi:hypothetical protein
MGTMPASIMISKTISIPSVETMLIKVTSMLRASHLDTAGIHTERIYGRDKPRGSIVIQIDHSPARQLLPTAVVRSDLYSEGGVREKDLPWMRVAK